jgi:hypothetical protein
MFERVEPQGVRSAIPYHDPVDRGRLRSDLICCPPEPICHSILKKTERLGNMGLVHAQADLPGVNYSDDFVVRMRFQWLDIDRP